MKALRPALFIALALVASSAFAQTIKIGFISTYSGLNANLGEYMERGMRLYMKLHDKELPPGGKLEIVVRDDTGPNPDKARQVAQELIVRDKVNLLTGVISTRSPYIARVSFTLWQSSYPLGQWAAKKFKRAYTLVSDYGPGHDAEQAFSQAFKAGGGQVIDSVRVPLQNPDFAAYMQRVKDAKPDALMVFIPAGKTATAVMKNFSDLGLDKAGIKLI